MVVRQNYNVIDMEKGTLDRRIFVDEEIYQQELEQIFGRAWLNISHDSLVPNPNDFFLSYMGEDPVIVTKDAKGGIHVFLNMCRHRGNRVVRADDGNAKNFMCTYHGWTFSNEGKLVSVPGLQEAYYGELDVENLGLVEARSDSYAGLIFATWDEKAPSLEAYLGDARWYLDLRFNRRDCGEIAIGPEKWIEPSNWKMPVDNCSDNYHTATSHIGSALVQVRYGQIRQGGIGHKALFETPAKHLFVNGHSLTVRVRDESQPRVFRNTTREADAEVFRKFDEDTNAEIERRLGSYRARRLTLGNHSLFPNTVLGFRLALPRGPFQTEFWNFRTYEKDAPEQIARGARGGLGSNGQGASSIVEQDDQDNWIQSTRSGISPQARKYRQDLSMGLRHYSDSDSEFVGIVSDRYISENNQRNFYSRWQEFMNARSWGDIHIDPISANFEGTATMKG